MSTGLHCQGSGPEIHTITESFLDYYNYKVGSTPRRQCPECLLHCHIRCNKCPSCHAVFPPSKKKLALGPPKKYPSNLLAQLHKKANQLHQVGYDVVILTHKSNPTLHTFQRIATPGAAVKFNVKYEKMYQLWKTYMSVKEKGESQGGAELSEIGEGCCSDLPSQPAERGSDEVELREMEGADLPSQPAKHASDDVVSPEIEGAELPSQPAERGSDEVGLPEMEGADLPELPSQPAERGSDEVESPEMEGADLPSQPTERCCDYIVSPEIVGADLPSQPAERGSDEVESPEMEGADLPSQPTERCCDYIVSPEIVGADLPSQPAKRGSDDIVSLEMEGAGLQSQPAKHGSDEVTREQSSDVGDTERHGSKQPAKPKDTENQDLSQTRKQSGGQKSRKHRRCGDCINCKKPKCQKCLPCQNPKWKKPCKERKCLQHLNVKIL